MWHASWFCALIQRGHKVLSGVVVNEAGKPLDAFCKADDDVATTDGSRRGNSNSMPWVHLTVAGDSHVGYLDAERTVMLPSETFGGGDVCGCARPLGGRDANLRRPSSRKATVADIREMKVEALDAIPPRLAFQALKSVAGVHMMSAGPGMLRPVLRGLSGLRVATLFLNARVESQAWGEGHGIFFPEQGVSRMDVIRGPEVLQYGPDAYGGVLKVVPTGPLAEVGRLTQLSLTGHSNTEGFQASVMTQKRSAKAHHVILSGVNRLGEYTLAVGRAVAGSALRQFYSQGRFGYLRDWGTWEGAYSSCYNTAGIVGTGGAEQSGDHMLTLGAHFRTGLWEWHPTVSYQLNHRKELDVVGPDSLTRKRVGVHAFGFEFAVDPLRHPYVALRREGRLDVDSGQSGLFQNQHQRLRAHRDVRTVDSRRHHPRRWSIRQGLS